MRRKAIIAALRADLDFVNRQLWEQSVDWVAQEQERKRLQAIVDRQDETILALWGLLEQQADDAPSDCISDGVCHETCTASYAEGCGAYLAKDAP